jgi:allantoicase
MTPSPDGLDLASERVGACVLAASDEFFAEKENLIKATDPVIIAGKYTDRGKWMDGWETRRKRAPGHDWAVLRLGIPGIIRGAVVDTRFFTGNYPEEASLEGCTATACTCVEDLTEWTELIPRSPLRGDTVNHFEVGHFQRFTHVRLNIFPDGGVARLRIHGEARPDWRSLGPEIDLAAAECGATIVDCSDQHFGHPQNLLMPGPGRDMSDGWETRRRRGPGHDWVMVRLAAQGMIERVEVDTSHFKGNFPDACSLEVSLTAEEGSWREVLPPSKLQAHTRHIFRQDVFSRPSPEPQSAAASGVTSAPAACFARFRIYPDGGVSRLRLWGRLTEEGRTQANLAALNSASPREALADFQRCCGSSAWAKLMEAARPYAEPVALDQAADAAWSRCSREDWLEAFSAHPRIGKRSEEKWSRHEQSGAAQAAPQTLRELEKLGLQYLEKFGYIFIVCATGKTAGELLAILRSRLQNSSGDEMRAAAEEQRLITRLRLRKLLRE